jgi:hypothetical protein
MGRVIRVIRVIRGLFFRVFSRLSRLKVEKGTGAPALHGFQERDADEVEGGAEDVEDGAA